MRIGLGVLLLARLANAQDPLLWGNLEPGPFSVGFRNSIASDGSRTYDGKRGRPILVDVWYPASSTTEAGFAYEGYLRVPEIGAFPWFRSRLESFVRDVVCDDLFHTKTEAGLNQEQRDAFSKLLATRTGAHLDAAPARGRFPLVIYHSGAGGSFEDNSVLFEYLASHGYVMVSSAFQSALPKSIGNNMGGIERSGPDLDFITQQSRDWPFVDTAKLGVVGHSAGAQILFLWIGARRCPARAFVSLDTTIEYSPENYQTHKWQRDAMKKRTPPRIPVLMFAQARLKPDFRAFDDYLKHSPHYQGVAAELSHDDFLTHGFLGRVLMQEPNASAVRRSYEEVCRTVRAFLDAFLKDDGTAERSLRQPSATSPISIRYQPAR